MNEILSKLFESRRIDEAKKKDAINAIADELDNRLKGVKGYTHHMLEIIRNYDEARVDIVFKDTNDSFAVYPQRTKISNENSNKVIKVDSIDGAYIEGTTVYDEEGNVIGEALVRMKAIHNKSDYSDSLENAEYRFNSKITNLQRLEKYVASEAINNMEGKHKK